MQRHRKQLANKLILATAMIAAAASALLNPPLARAQAPSKGMDPQLLARANAGDANSQYLVAFAYDKGIGVPKDPVRAGRWYRKAAEAGNRRSMAILGVMYEHGLGGLARDDVQAVSWYRKAAEAGEASAMTNLGLMYAAGRGGLTKDEVQAVSWYRKAAEAGDAGGMTRLGFAYTTGRGGLPRDDDQAETWARKAAEFGDAQAMGMLGTMYEAGQGGLAKDDAQAVEWYRKAAEAGDRIGMTYLGDMYMAGRGGLAKDDVQAVSWFRKAAEAGDASGMVKLGAMYMVGHGGLPQDKAQAVSWLTKAAELHDANALKALAQLEQANVRCIGRDGLGNQLTPVELYKDVASCIDQEKYDDGLFLFALAGAYGRFDILRVKDATAHGVVGFLPGMFFNQLDKTKVAAFQDRVKQMSGNDSLKAKYCSDLESMSPPQYFPTYMISHGLAATANALGAPLPGNSPGDNPLVSPFDAPKAWKQAVDEYLQCKKPEGTGR
jgi:TPR repeat protein